VLRLWLYRPDRVWNILMCMPITATTHMAMCVR